VEYQAPDLEKLDLTGFLVRKVEDAKKSGMSSWKATWDIEGKEAVRCDISASPIAVT
jgi:hypothetical protein